MLDVRLSSPLPSTRFPWPPKRSSRFRSGVLAIFQYLDAVDEDVLHSHRILMRFFESRVIGNRPWVKNDDIRKHSFLKKPAMVQAQVRRGQPSQSCDCFGQRNKLFVPDVTA